MKFLLLILFVSYFISCRPTNFSDDSSDPKSGDTIATDPVDTIATDPADTIVAIEVNLTIDVSIRTHKVSKNPAGVVSCWLMDSDLERPRKTSFSNALKEMGVKYIRFPYGHLADNYLWDADGDWGNTLTPKVATFSQAPAAWEWAVDSASGEFIKDMDFDEYISICTEVGAEPMVVVNILSYKYKNGPTYEQLKKSAIEWVRYANLTKGYNVKRWALGNEVDHHSDIITQQEYIDLYVDFAEAMKAIDPSILVGPGLLKNWQTSILTNSPNLIDFMCVHNYLYAYNWRNENYEGWKNATDNMVNNVEKCQNTVNKSSVPNIEIHVTEMNARPWKDKSDNDDIFRALAYGEMILNASSFKNVKATYVWNTHGPWGGENANAAYNVLDLDNNLEPRGEVMKMINEGLLDYYIEIPRVNNFIRQYATVSDNNNNISLILINKNNHSLKFNVKVTNLDNFTNYSQTIYAGKSSSDENPEYYFVENKSIQDNVIALELKPLSINVITLDKIEVE